MPTHSVIQGECISSIAARFGLTEEAIYDHPSNVALRKSRPSRNILNPGDQLFIPSTSGHEEVCATGSDHPFIVRIAKVDLGVVLTDHTGVPFAGRKFRVTASNLDVSGVTGSDGLVKVAVPTTLEKVSLSAWLYEDDGDAEPDAKYELQLGHLDPHDTITGVQARLENLGYGCSVTGSVDEATVAAIRHFRHVQNLTPDDEGNPIDDALRSFLANMHEGGAK